MEPFEKRSVHFIAGKKFSRTSNNHTVAEGGKKLFKEKAVGTLCGVDVPLTISGAYWHGGPIKHEKMMCQSVQRDPSPIQPVQRRFGALWHAKRREACNSEAMTLKKANQEKKILGRSLTTYCDTLQ